jgi:hypothetical protein
MDTDIMAAAEWAATVAAEWAATVAAEWAAEWAAAVAVAISTRKSTFFYSTNFFNSIAALKQTITEGVLREAGSRSVEQLAQEESEILLGLLRLRAGVGQQVEIGK